MPNVKDKTITVENMTEALCRLKPRIPTVTATDSGKILQVNSAGKWALAPFAIYNGTVVTNDG